MVDHFLSNPTHVSIAGVVVAVFVWGWRYLDQRNDPHARRADRHRRDRPDDR